MKLIAYAGSRESGVWWLRMFGYGVQVKAPWNKPLFSERNGYRKFFPKRGWRIGVLKP